MELDEGKRQFIESWGQLGINWGTNKTVGMVHALLLMTPTPMCSDEIMSQLEISRGNVNINTRTLIDWGLVYKKFKKGERKEYFIAEKDVLKIFKAVIYQRKKKEFDPMLKVLEEIKSVERNCEESNEFCNVVNGLYQFSNQADKALSNLINTDSKWILGAMMRFMH
ncbi:MAG: transcriptional regulator [Saprospiraceae bacterium]|nr:transcriptional regulator [Saprospiraceae bacterium]